MPMKNIDIEIEVQQILTGVFKEFATFYSKALTIKLQTL